VIRTTALLASVLPWRSDATTVGADAFPAFLAAGHDHNHLGATNARAAKYAGETRGRAPSDVGPFVVVTALAIVT
jgi:hypothetical protein